MSAIETGGLSITHSSRRTGCPDLRLLHYNDVYHVEYVPHMLVSCASLHTSEGAN